MTTLQFEKLVEETVKQVQQRLRDADIGSEFVLTIEARGRVQEGNVKISYELDRGYYDAAKSTGYALAPVVDEFLRRFGWNKRNAPLAISYDPVQGEPIEVPGEEEVFAEPRLGT